MSITSQEFSLTCRREIHVSGSDICDLRPTDCSLNLVIIWGGQWTGMDAAIDRHIPWTNKMQKKPLLINFDYTPSNDITPSSNTPLRCGHVKPAGMLGSLVTHGWAGPKGLTLCCITTYFWCFGLYSKNVLEKQVNIGGLQSRRIKRLSDVSDHQLSSLFYLSMALPRTNSTGRGNICGGK